MPVLMMTLLMLTGVFMMFIILLQRGRGGGLAGALGGMGGQSAFGTKAGDVFTKITVVIAVAWVMLAGFGGIVLRNSSGNRFNDRTAAPIDQAKDDSANETTDSDPVAATMSDATATSTDAAKQDGDSEATETKSNSNPVGKSAEAASDAASAGAPDGSAISESSGADKEAPKQADDGKSKADDGSSSNAEKAEADAEPKDATKETPPDEQ